MIAFHNFYTQSQPLTKIRAVAYACFVWCFVAHYENTKSVFSSTRIWICVQHIILDFGTLNISSTWFLCPKRDENVENTPSFKKSTDLLHTSANLRNRCICTDCSLAVYRSLENFNPDLFHCIIYLATLLNLTCTQKRHVSVIFLWQNLNISLHLDIFY